MIKNIINGFCMALADSVPGVSGGTVAFIMGFYDQFINSIHSLMFGHKDEKKASIIYLCKLAVGWIIGMSLSVMILSSLFESHIYIISSVFIGFIAGAIPLVIIEEKQTLKGHQRDFIFLIIGALVVALITWMNKSNGDSSMNVSVFSIPTAIELFFIGMIAISAMFLPGISGSTLLLIFGAYIPIITAVKSLFSANFSSFPNLCFFGLGILAGALSIVRLIKFCLDKYRAQTVYLIIGMMIGSFYAIIMGPTTLEIPQAPMSLQTFDIIFAVIGCVLVFSMQLIKDRK